MSPRTVLVIDDEEATRFAVRLALEDAGYAVAEVGDGRAGLALLRRARGPLVVLLDLMMPRMSGLALLSEIGKEPELALCHAFIVTSARWALAMPDLAQYLRGDHLSILPKPFEIDDLLARVVEAAGRLGA